MNWFCAPPNSSTLRTRRERKRSQLAEAHRAVAGVATQVGEQQVLREPQFREVDARAQARRHVHLALVGARARHPVDDRHRVLVVRIPLQVVALGGVVEDPGFAVGVLIDVVIDAQDVGLMQLDVRVDEQALEQVDRRERTRAAHVAQRRDARLLGLGALLSQHRDLVDLALQHLEHARLLFAFDLVAPLARLHLHHRRVRIDRLPGARVRCGAGSRSRSRRSTSGGTGARGSGRRRGRRRLDDRGREGRRRRERRLRVGRLRRDRLVVGRSRRRRIGREPRGVREQGRRASRVELRRRLHQLVAGGRLDVGDHTRPNLAVGLGLRLHEPGGGRLRQVRQHRLGFAARGDEVAREPDRLRRHRYGLGGGLGDLHRRGANDEQASGERIHRQRSALHRSTAGLVYAL